MDLKIRALLITISLHLLFISGSAGRLSPTWLPSQMKLVHVLNSPESPHYAANLTLAERLDTLTRMEHQRLAYRGRGGRVNTREPLQYSGTGTYTIRASFGTPTQEIILVVDTGSDMLWFPCSRGHFTASKSSSFTPLRCVDELCQVVPNANPNQCSNKAASCRFTYGYDGGDSLSGNMIFERAVVDGTVIPRLAMGCATRVSNAGLSGLMGLGRGPLSIVAQASNKFHSTFSYCLADFHTNRFSSYLKLGRDGTPGLKYTTMVGTADYRVQVDQVHVGDYSQAVPLAADVWNQNGGTVFDSGTTMTYLQRPALDAIWNAYYTSVKLQRVQVEGLGACFDVSGLNKRQIEQAIPALSFTFGGGVVFRPPLKNLFVDPQPGVKCLGFMRAGKGWPTLLGNLLQQGFHFENDLKNNRIGFAYTECRP